jgi:hypothetical protein
MTLLEAVFMVGCFAIIYTPVQKLCDYKPHGCAMDKYLEGRVI